MELLCLSKLQGWSSSVYQAVGMEFLYFSELWGWSCSASQSCGDGVALFTRAAGMEYLNELHNVAAKWAACFDAA